MSALTRIPVFIALALALAACGFRPLYGKIGADPRGASSFASIYVEPIPERVGYELRSNLIDLFETQMGAGAPYRLKIELKSEEKGVALQENASITRYTYRLSARYRLVSGATGAILKKGDIHSLTSYNVVQSPYATVVADKDAQDRAARDVAERIRTELAVYFMQTRSAKS